ncbi:hypothetical protein FV222_05970 [Methylobacterium sp. WL103]|uniref:hypothetical protein n=1 Tax=Methylobacterium sp. WL103 TaxID=2603891 RepID=UPI0011DAA329|nr:hypothetical protein [Methylobacterium sp. WL103]TXN06337.1 hypothetical protein FV222_05970 [Methylobacterium sp. WL103]
MSRLLPNPESVTPRVLQVREKAVPTPKQARQSAKGVALARRLRGAADRHEAGQAGEDVTDLSSADFIAHLRR